MEKAFSLRDARVKTNPDSSQLCEEITHRSEGRMVAGGAIVVRTGLRTGWSPRDKYIVDEPEADGVSWGETNQPMAEKNFDRLLGAVEAYLRRRKTYIQDCYAGMDPQYRVPIRIITEMAWHSLFVRNMFIHRRDGTAPGFTIVAVPEFQVTPRMAGTNSEAFIAIHFGKKLALIGGKHSRSVPNFIHSEFRTFRSRPSSETYFHVDGRCFWGASSDFPLESSTSDVSLPFRIYGESRRNGSWTVQRTAGYIQHMFRRSFHATPFVRLCGNAADDDAEIWRRMLANKHGVERRSIRNGQTHQDRLHARND